MKPLNWILVLLISFPAIAQENDVWVIAHMVNSVGAVRWAAEEGANGIEADLQFDSEWNPTVFRHGGECDCTCTIAYGICSQLNCGTSAGTTAWFAAVAATPQLGLVVIDSKVGDSAGFTAGTKVVKTLESELFDKNYKGMVIISASKLDAFPYLHAAATAAKASKYKDRMYFTIDGERQNVLDVLNLLVYQPLPSRNIVYGTGISACLPNRYFRTIRTAAANRKAGVIGFVYIWTIDKETSASDYLDAGARGIITNDPRAIVETVSGSGNKYHMAKPGRPFFPSATSKRVQR